MTLHMLLVAEHSKASAVLRLCCSFSAAFMSVSGMQARLCCVSAAPSAAAQLTWLEQPELCAQAALVCVPSLDEVLDAAEELAIEPPLDDLPRA